jgi:hypothetical protein
VARDVVSLSGYAYLAEGSGVRVVDVSAPSSPTEIGFSETGGGAWGVAANRQTLLVADRAAGLAVFDSCQGGLFSDGFETGDTSVWSATFP